MTITAGTVSGASREQPQAGLDAGDVPLAVVARRDGVFLLSGERLAAKAAQVVGADAGIGDRRAARGRTNP